VEKLFLTTEKTGQAKVVFAGKKLFSGKKLKGFARIVIKINFCCTVSLCNWKFVVQSSTTDTLNVYRGVKE